MPRLASSLQSSHHPFVETFKNITLSSEQHPRSRFLLLIQALEGLYGFEHQEEQYERRQAYKNERQEFLDHMNKIIAEDDRQFLSENLLRNPYVSLESALIAIFNGFSASVREEIDAAGRDIWPDLRLRDTLTRSGLLVAQ